jgi:hypothetical protein
MAWEIEFTDEFREWWNILSEKEQGVIDASVKLLEEFGPGLARPHADSLSKMSKHANMKELRVQIAGDAYRILFAFDPRRVGILLMGARKADQKWYKDAVPQADSLYDDHLRSLQKGRRSNGGS